jgi:hypothetical protein
MASSVQAVLCALLGAALWTALGYAISRRLLPRSLAAGAAPVVGWAIFSAASLPILTLIGFTASTVIAVGAPALLGSAVRLVLRRDKPDSTPAIPLWTYAAGAALALGPAAAIVPKISADGVRLADPIFDHSKIATIDAMARQGLPAIDPVFSTAGRLVYYYLWHFSAAELALVVHASGWEADIGLTWFTGFASLALMMGVAVWLSGRSGAAILVVVFAAAASLRVTLSWIFGPYALTPFLAAPTGFAGWLFQTSWAPHHVMSAGCVVASLLLLVFLAQRQSLLGFVALVLLVAAGFESSTYVGGVTFAIAALAAAPILLRSSPANERLRFAAGLALAALLVLALAAPFIRDQLAAVAGRGGRAPIALHPFEVLGDLWPTNLRRTLDLPAYWVILLPIEFPAAFVAGIMALAAMLGNLASGPKRTVSLVLAVLAAASLCASWLLVSTVGDNSDLTLRAVLPAVIILIAYTAAALMCEGRRFLIATAAFCGLGLSLPDSARMLRSNIDGTARLGADLFAQAPDLWAAVRRHAPPTARVANNPLYLQDMTPWPVNVSWALLANRSSCFAGRELVLTFTPLPPPQRHAINDQFIRVFAGHGTSADIDAMAKVYGCDVIVLVPQDGAWSNDPFASSADFRPAEFRDGRWKIYVKK